MQSAPTETVASREAQLGDTRYFRRFNPFALGSDVDGLPSWNNLLADLRELIERIEPQIIVLPHPHLDPHPDHLCSQQAVMQALSGTAWQPETLLHYANHLHDNDRWPMGDAGTGVALPPQIGVHESLRPWTPVSVDRQPAAQGYVAGHDARPSAPASLQASAAPGDTTLPGGSTLAGVRRKRFFA